MEKDGACSGNSALFFLIGRLSYNKVVVEVKSVVSMLGGALNVKRRSFLLFFLTSFFRY